MARTDGVPTEVHQLSNGHSAWERRHDLVVDRPCASVFDSGNG